MKQLFSVSCVFLLLLAIPAKDVTGLAWNCWYLINKEYVARELCVNKAKPEMQCNGKCHLAKQLNKLDAPTGKEKKPATRHFKPMEVNWITQDVSPEVVLLPALSIRQKHNWFLPNKTPHSVSFPIFHPPSA